MSALEKALRVAKEAGGETAVPPPVETGTPAVDTSTPAPATTPAATTTPTDYTDYITGLYKDILGRSPDPSGLQNWQKDLQSGTKTKEDVYNYFMSSPENVVQDMYQLLLGRQLEDPNVSWVKALQAGTMTPEQIQAGIMASEEYKKLHPSASSGTGSGTAADAGMQLIYQPGGYKDYGATPAAYRVASLLEQLPYPFATLSPTVPNTRTTAPPTSTTGGTSYQDVLSGLGDTTPTTPTMPTQAAKYEKYLKGLYGDILGRSPDAEGMKYWMDALLSGRLSEKDVRRSFLASPENQVQDTYLDTLGRQPDAEGMAYWRAKIESGELTPEQVQRAIAASPEATKAPLEAAYEEYLGRAPDLAGLQYWQSQISSGTHTLDEVINAIALSQEAQNRLNSTTYKRGGVVPGYADGGSSGYSLEDLVNAAYRNFLYREPDKAGYDYWLNELKSGAYAPSEFERIFKSAGYEDEVAQAYKDLFNRAPDPEGLKYWQTELEQGKYSPDKLQEIMKSAGYEDEVAQAYKDVFGRAPDPEGRDYWLKQLNSGEITVPEFINALKKSPEQAILDKVPQPDVYSELQGGARYAIDIGNVERMPQLKSIPTPVNVVSEYTNSELARLRAELEALKAGQSGSKTTNGTGGGGEGGGGGSNFGGSDASGTVGGVQSDPAGGPQGPSAPDSSSGPDPGAGEAYGGRINAVDNALRLIKAGKR